jgi:uncharacterized protein
MLGVFCRRRRLWFFAFLAFTYSSPAVGVTPAIRANPLTAVSMPKTCGQTVSSPKTKVSSLGSANNKPLRIGTGNVGGVFFPYGGGISEAIQARTKLQVDVLATGGSVDNLQLLKSGDLDLALTTVDAATDAVVGNSPYGSPVKMCALAVLYTSYVHVVTLATSGITELAGLAGKRISVGSALSSTEATADRLLRAAGIDPLAGIERVNGSLAESVSELLSGRIDALFWVGGVPTAAIVDLTNTQPVRFLDTSAFSATLAREFGNVYQSFKLPTGSYRGVNTDVRGLGIGNLLVAQASLSNQTVEKILQAIFSDLDRLKLVHPEARKLTMLGASQPTAIPFHTGAKGFYRSHCSGSGKAKTCTQLKPARK